MPDPTQDRLLQSADGSELRATVAELIGLTVNPHACSGRVITLIRAQVAREIEAESDPGAGFADVWNRAIKRCASIARGALS